MSLEDKAKEYANGFGHGATIPKRMHKDICDGIALKSQVAYEWGYKQAIKDLIERAKVHARDVYDLETPMIPIEDLEKIAEDLIK